MVEVIPFNRLCSHNFAKRFSSVSLWFVRSFIRSLFRTFFDFDVRITELLIIRYGKIVFTVAAVVIVVIFNVRDAVYFEKRLPRLQSLRFHPNDIMNPTATPMITTEAAPAQCIHRKRNINVQCDLTYLLGIRFHWYKNILITHLCKNMRAWNLQRCLKCDLAS